MDQRSVIVVSPDLRPGVESILIGLDEFGMLQKFVTTLGVTPAGMTEQLVRLLPSHASTYLRKLLSRRQVPANAAGKTKTYPYREVVRVSFRRAIHDEVIGDYLWWWAERGFDRTVARRWAGVAPIVYGFELASAETFRAQKQAGGWCVLGQLIAHHRTTYTLLQEELERFPQVGTNYTQRGLDTAARVNALKDEQYADADLIVANSSYVKDTFIEAGISGDKIVVVPGAGPQVDGTYSGRSKSTNGKTVFLNAGTQSIRKGTPYLLEAWRRLQPVTAMELWLAGRVDLPAALLENLPGHVELFGSLPHSELFNRYQEASVLVLPSLSEGFALVILEAMAHGLPIITTPNSGCGDFVEDGVNGWVVGIRDVDALADRMSWCCDNPKALAAMGARSREKAKQWSWGDYQRLHTDVICSFTKSLGV